MVRPAVSSGEWRCDRTMSLSSLTPGSRPLSADRAKRRLSVIVATDVVGFSRLMQDDDEGTLATLMSRRREILEPLIETYRGRLVKVMGDGALMEFASAVDAVEFSVSLQGKTASANQGLPDNRRVVLRIGICLGDIIVEGRDIYGDGVNIASRLQAMCEPGDVLLSESVHDQVRRKLRIFFEDLGSWTVKNIADPIRVYRMRPEEDGLENLSRPLPLPAKPSIAVLPFTNMSGQNEGNSLVEGLSVDLITELSRHPGLFVIASHSALAFKNKADDIRAVARELGVRYVLEGSAQRFAGRVRINALLIDAVEGGHLWAERFERKVEDIFAVQDEVVGKISEALVGRLTERPVRYRPKNLLAYERCVRGRALLVTSPGSPESVREACLLLRQAIAYDAEYAEAICWLAFSFWSLWSLGIDADVSYRPQSLELIEKAVSLDPNDPANHWVQGYLLAYDRRFDESDAAFARAFALAPDQPDALVLSADIQAMNGSAELAIERVEKALRLNPHPASWYYWVLGLAYYAARRFEEAASVLRTEATYRTGSRRILAASLAQLGRTEEARHEAELFMVNNPNFSIAKWCEASAVREGSTVELFAEGYRKAGLPE